MLTYELNDILQLDCDITGANPIIGALETDSPQLSVGLNDVVRFNCELSGSASVTQTLSKASTVLGDIKVPKVINPSIYQGDYQATPRAENEVVLPTQGYLMAEDVVVLKVPYYETSNLSGETVYIASEV